MTVYCLASEYDRLSPAQQRLVDHILADDGEWTQDMIARAIQFPLEDPHHPDDWTRP